MSTEVDTRVEADTQVEVDTAAKASRFWRL
jgi:hypothetical protein